MWETLSDLWNNSMFRVVSGIAITSALVALGYKLLARLRGLKDEDQVSETEMLLNFREMASQGDLSKQEYRIIESLLVKPRDEESRRRPKSRTFDATEGLP
ncbi:MAG: hypothetical protein QM811_09235 [Pirellulales bacterium]